MLCPDPGSCVCSNRALTWPSPSSTTGVTSSEREESNWRSAQAPTLDLLAYVLLSCRVRWHTGQQSIVADETRQATRVGWPPPAQVSHLESQACYPQLTLQMNFQLSHPGSLSFSCRRASPRSDSGSGGAGRGACFELWDLVSGLSRKGTEFSGKVYHWMGL